VQSGNIAAISSYKGVSVNESLRKLLALQEIDEQIARIEEQLAEIPVLRAKAIAPMREAQREVETSTRALKEAQAAQRQIEGDVREAEDLLKHLETNSFQVKSNEAYRVILGEIEAAKGKVSSAETKILELMETIDRVGGELEAAKARAAEIRGTAIADEEKFAKEAAMLEHELAFRRESRGQWIPSIDPSLFSQYERIATRRRLPVAFVAENTCGGCHVVLPAQTMAEIRRGDRIVTCRDCKRILVSESMLGEKPEAESPEASSKGSVRATR